MDERNILYEEKPLSEPGSLEYVKSLGHSQAPVVVTPAGESWSGFQPDRINSLIA